MRIKRSYKRKGPPILLIGTLGIVVVCAASFVLATLWHEAQQPVAASPSPGAVQVQGEGEGDSLTLEQGVGYSPAAEEGGEGGERPSMEWPVYEGAVPPGERVSNDYFDDAIFFGDSISSGIPLYHVADNAAVVAVNGASPYNAVDEPLIKLEDGAQATMLEAARQYGERNKVYIMLGSSGLWMDEKTFAECYQRFIDEVRAAYPEAVIYLQSMTPVNPKAAERYEAVSNEKIIEYNALILELARQNGLYFVNVFEALAGPDGYLPDEASSDGVHLTAEYYAIWFEYLKTHTVEGS